MMDHRPLEPDLKALWIEFNSRFKELVYPTLFQPYGIPFVAAYQTWSMACLAERTQGGPPDSIFIPDTDKEDDDSEAWKG